MKRLKLFLMLGMTGAALCSRADISYQGRVIRPDGRPPQGTVNFTLEIRSFGVSDVLEPTCVLYREWQSADLSKTAGLFDLNLGGGTFDASVSSPQLSLNQIFLNERTFGNLNECASSAGVWSAHNGSKRYLVVSLQDGSGPLQRLSPMVINEVPFATTLQGKSKYEFIWKTSSGEGLIVPQGDNANRPANPQPGYLRYNTILGKLEVYSGASNTWESLESAVATPLSGVIAGDGLSGGGASGNVTVSVDSGVTVGKILKIPAGAAHQVLALNAAGTALEYKTLSVGTGLSLTSGAGTLQITATGGGGGGSSSVAASSPLTLVDDGTTATISLPAATASANGHLTSADWTTFNNKQSGSAELTGLATLIGTGILQKNSSGNYSTLGTLAPLTTSSGTGIGLSLSSTSSGLAVSGGNLVVNPGAGLVLNGSNQLIPDFSTGADAGKVVQANDARLPSSACAAGNKSRYTGTAWVCEADETSANEDLPKDWREVLVDVTAVAGDRLLVNTEGGEVTVTLPASPVMGATVSIVDASGSFATNKLTVNRNGQKIMGLIEDLEVTDANISFELVFYNSNYGWRIK